ncbi:MAG TPA: cobalamin-binding protein [Spirochaetes bacterium]|nr:cobalamin-binding protein [Spirochaetota bacterium]
MYEELKELIIVGDEDKAKEFTQKILSEGKNADEILKGGLVAGMDVVGQRFKEYEMYLPEVIMSATAMKTSMEVLKPHLSKSGASSMGTVVIGTIEGDVHDIGKNLVSMMLEGAGFKVVDLGVDVQVEKIIEAAEKENADVIGLSALLTTTMLALEPSIKMVKEKISGIKVMVGGSPLTQEFADKVGADGFAPDALRAINLAKKLAGKQ